MINFQVDVVDVWIVGTDIAISAAILLSYIVVVWNEKRSPLYPLVTNFFKEDGWKHSDPIDLRDLRQSMRQISGISATLAGISLATVAFITPNTIQAPINIENLVSSVMLLSAAVLCFWALGLHFNNSLPTSTNYKLNAKTFKRGYFFTSFGVYLFFNGLLWALSVISIWYTIVAFVAYGISYGFMIHFRPIRN